MCIFIIIWTACFWTNPNSNPTKVTTASSSDNWSSWSSIIRNRSRGRWWNREKARLMTLGTYFLSSSLCIFSLHLLHAPCFFWLLPQHNWLSINTVPECILCRQTKQWSCCAVLRMCCFGKSGCVDTTSVHLNQTWAMTGVFFLEVDNKVNLLHSENQSMLCL